MTKAKTKREDQLTTPHTEQEPKASGPILYDTNASQSIPLHLEKNGRTYRVVHKLSPLSDSRYFTFRESEAGTISRLRRVNTSITKPMHDVWKELCEGIENYSFEHSDDWKDRVHLNDAVAALTGLLFVQIIDEAEIEPDGESDVYDDDEPCRVGFRAMFSGALVSLEHRFREPSQSEADEFLSITSNQPNDRDLASSVKKSEAEKLAALGKRMLVDVVGYQDSSRVPAWHLSQTCKAHFVRQAERLGKFLTASHLTPSEK